MSKFVSIEKVEILRLLDFLEELHFESGRTDWDLECGKYLDTLGSEIKKLQVVVGGSYED